MKNVKRLFIIGICLVMVCFLFGCDKSVSLIEGYSRIVKCYIGEEGVFENTDAYEYSSNNSNVLKVQNGTYTALSEGSAAVTVREKKAERVAVLLFVVFGEKPIEIQSLNINGSPEGNSLTVTEECRLTYGKTPANSNRYDAIVWSSDNPEVLSVDGSGNLRANKMGSATVTVKALGTSVEAKTTISVLPRETQFCLNYNAVAGVVGTEEELLSATVLTDYPFDGNVEWYSLDEQIAEVDEGKLVYRGLGKTEVGIRAVINGVDYKASCSVSVCEDNAYTVIRTPEQLQSIANNSGNYMLGNDIDMKEACSKGGVAYNAGLGFLPLFANAQNAFSGLFEGNGFAIRNLAMYRDGEVFVAFMRYISAVPGKEGKIRNLAIENAEIHGGNYTSVFYANAAGYGSAESGLENCYAQGEIYALGSCSALVGNNKGVISNCVSVCKIDAIGKVNLLVLNQTAVSDTYGVENCVYVGEAEAELVELKNGGFANNCFAVTEEEAAGFDFSFLGSERWVIEAGKMPALKGV